jgi:hypothetical protein
VVDLEDRDRNVERLANAVDQLPLLPRAVIRGAQSNEDVVRPKATHRIGEGAQWCFVTYSAGLRRGRR